MYGDIWFESKFRPEDASKLKSGMKSACTIGNRERWRVGGKGEGWMIERGGDLPIWDGKGYPPRVTGGTERGMQFRDECHTGDQSGRSGADYPRDERRRAGAGGRVCGRRLHYKWNGYRTLIIF